VKSDVVLSCGSLQASHAWDSLYIDLLKSLSAFLEGAAPDETFIWLVRAREVRMNVLLLQLSHSSTPSVEQDIFAINQDDSGGTFSAMDELDDGKTLARVIELSRSTLVVLDSERAAPFARLWCADVVFA